MADKCMFKDFNKNSTLNEAIAVPKFTVNTTTRCQLPSLRYLFSSLWTQSTVLSIGFTYDFEHIFIYLENLLTPWFFIILTAAAYLEGISSILPTTWIRRYNRKTMYSPGIKNDFFQSCSWKTIKLQEDKLRSNPTDKLPKIGKLINPFTADLH